MTSLNNYYSEIRSDIAKEFGLEAGGYAPRPKYYVSIREAQIINDKYPAIWEEGAMRPTPNPKAVRIIKRLKAIRIANEKKGGN
jgi:hypothetical protein